MRNRQFLVIIALTIFSWGAITYYLFLQRPPSKNLIYNFKAEIDNLELELERQYHLNQQLLNRVRHLRVSLSSSNDSQDVGADGNPNYLSNSAGRDVIAVLVFGCNRVTIKRNIDQLIQYRPSKEQFPIIVSQDCGHSQTAKVIQSYGDQLIHIQQPDLSDIAVPPKEKKFKGYYKIARHYGWALNQTFRHFNHDTVIIVEDDLDIAPDFFEYFMATSSILKADPTLWCVSAWNDNGKDTVTEENPETLYRTDFFPGLGWMLTKTLWNELESKWPKSYWDDWMRQPEQRKERACIRPEVSRSKTFGKIGVSNGLFYEKHLKFIKLNEKYVPFTSKDLSFLKKDNYDVQFVKSVYDSPSITWDELKAGKVTQEGSVRITYQTKEMFKKITKVFGLMDDLKSGVPRTGYRGIVSFFYKGRRVYLAPPADWKGYDTSWS